VTFPTKLQVFLLFFGTRFEVLTPVGIYNAVWVRTLHSLVVMIILEEHSGSTYTGHQKIEGVCPHLNLGTHQSIHVGLVTQNTIILNINILCFLWTVSLFIRNQIHTSIKQYIHALLFYIIF
jgi:hypothetical protein